MRFAPLACFVCWLAACPASGASFVIDLNAETWTDRDYLFSDGELRYGFYPYIDVSEDGGSTAAFVSFTSPDNSFKGYENNPEAIGSSVIYHDQASVTDKLSGVWRLTIDDGVGAYDYDIDVSFTLPFAEFPHFSSSTLIDGTPLGEFSWTLAGGSAAFPGGSSKIWASLSGERHWVALDSETLPFGTTSWTPQGDFSQEPALNAFVTTLSEAMDSTSLRILGIRPLTANAPDVSFGDVTVTYTTTMRVTLLPPVPEPASWVAVAIAVVASALPKRVMSRKVTQPVG